MKSYRIEYDIGAIVYANHKGITCKAKIISEIESAGIYTLKFLPTPRIVTNPVMRSPHKIYETEEQALAALKII